MPMNDYESDIELGQWIRDERTRCGLSLTDVARTSGISAQRLKELEDGQAKKSITRLEAKSLAVAYKIELSEILRRATGESEL